MSTSVIDPHTGGGHVTLPWAPVDTGQCNEHCYYYPDPGYAILHTQTHHTQYTTGRGEK